MDELVHFNPVEEFKSAADILFEGQKARIVQQLPFAEIHHIGSTAIPGSITKGDVDANVRVRKEDFDVAVRVLKEMYEINQLKNWTDEFASFKDDVSFALPFGVQLTAIGSRDDSFLAHQDFLLKHPAAVEKINEIKRRYEGKSMDEYREEKGHFFQELFQ